MKNYNSQIEFEWIEVGPNGNISVTEPKLSELNDFYLSKKPQLEQNNTYEFIGMDITEENESFRGILNSRIDGNHIQIRF